MQNIIALSFLFLSTKSMAMRALIGRSAFMVLVYSLFGCAHATAGAVAGNCIANSDLQKRASAELQKLVQADQNDRKDPTGATIDWTKVSPRDLQRRMEVAKLFAEGCFKDAADYAAAALVFQHGDTADHAFQTFIWGKRAVELGDKKQMPIMAEGVDRFLVRSGQKQLFATQLAKDAGNPCFCLEPTEESFPDSVRIEYTRLSYQDNLDRMPTFWNKDQPSCGRLICKHNLKPSPRGTAPGLW